MGGECCCGGCNCGGEKKLVANQTHSNGGYTQKEMLNLILDGQDKINERIDELHEKVNSKMSRSEVSGWIVAVSALVVLVNTVAM